MQQILAGSCGSCCVLRMSVQQYTSTLQGVQPTGHGTMPVVVLSLGEDARTVQITGSPRFLCSATISILESPWPHVPHVREFA